MSLACADAVQVLWVSQLQCSSTHACHVRSCADAVQVHPFWFLNCRVLPLSLSSADKVDDGEPSNDEQDGGDGSLGDGGAGAALSVVQDPPKDGSPSEKPSGKSGGACAAKAKAKSKPKPAPQPKKAAKECAQSTEHSALPHPHQSLCPSRTDSQVVMSACLEGFDHRLTESRLLFCSHPLF